MKTTAAQRVVQEPNSAQKSQAASSQASGPAPPSDAPAATRACPTRISGGTPLFQHSLTVSQCQSKQRGLYHKCFSCAHANGRA